MTRAPALVLVAACGRIGFAPPLDAAAGDDAGPHSGTRLKLVYDRLGDGARQEAGIFDSQRGEHCQVTTLPDGIPRCTPANLAIASYTDASCTQPVAVGDGGCLAEPRYVVDQDGCFRFAAIYPVVGPSTATGYFIRSLDGCLGPFPAGSTAIFDVGPAVAPAALAALVLGPPVGTGRLAVRSYTSADGLAIPAPPYDTALAATCTPVGEPDGTWSCRPEDRSYTSERLDATCAQPLGIGIASCPAPAFGEYDAVGMCGKRLARLGAPILPAPAQLYAPSAGTCVANPANLAFAYFALGADVDAALLTRAPVADAPRRIWPVELASGDARVRDTAVFDSALGTDCSVATTRDGAARCVPAGGYVSHLFSDAGCTASIDVVLVQPGGSCPASVPAFARGSTGTGCAIATLAYRVGAPYTGALYSPTGTACVASGTAATAYTVTEVDPAELVAATRVTDP